MDPTVHLLLSVSAFVGTHFVSSTAVRPALVRRLGEPAYLALYSCAALATLAWAIVAYRSAPSIPLWPGLKLVPAFVMPFACILLTCGLWGPNPTSVGQGARLEEPEPARGILRVTRHPVQWAILLWALSHLAARGDLRALVLFGGLALLSAFGMPAIDRRKARAGGEGWRRFARATSVIPFAAIAAGRNRLRAAEIGLWPPLAGLVLYAVLFYLHPVITGVRPY